MSLISVVIADDHRLFREGLRLILDQEESIGAQIVKKACEAPIRQLATNAELDGSLIVREVLQSDSATCGFNAITEQVEDLLLAGVIDPAKVPTTVPGPGAMVVPAAPPA